MNFAAAALLGLTMGQPPGPDYHALNSRQIKLPIEYKKDRRAIRQVTLYVARNGENTWYQEGFVAPDQNAFVYVAKDDGIYWFKMQIEDLKGNKDPVDLTRDPPDMKVVVDTTKPVIRVTGAKRTGDEIVIEWAVDDKFPDDEKTRVQFRATNSPDGPWQDVTLPAAARTGVRFPSGIADGVTVKITAADIAGNRTEVTRDFPAGGNATTALSPPTGPAASAPLPTAPPAFAGSSGVGAAPPPPPMDLNPGPAPLLPGGPPAPAAPAAPLGGIAPASPGAAFPPSTPPAASPGAALPSGPPPGAALAGGSPPLPSSPPLTAAPSGPPNSQPLVEGPKPLPTVDPRAVPPAPSPGTATPAAAWTGGPSPTVEVTRAQVINYPRFDLGFDLEQRGPSGISRVDLWVTRDEGRSWQKWSQHDGKGGAVRVALDAKENPQLEGGYGFRLVPVSGAGLSEREPVNGDAPDMRVVLDVTPPQLDLFPPASDPNAPDTLVIQWKATDRNFGDDPITLEWSDSPTGPWKPVAGSGTDPVVQATALNAPVAKRLPNTGQYAWKVPAGVPARVYLKATATDAAGNVKPVVTREPILVDLTKPKAKINGIVPSVTPRP